MDYAIVMVIAIAIGLHIVNGRVIMWTYINRIWLVLSYLFRLPHSSTLSFSHPSSVLTQASPGERQSFEMNGMFSGSKLIKKRIGGLQCVNHFRFQQRKNESLELFHPLPFRGFPFSIAVVLFSEFQFHKYRFVRVLFLFLWFGWFVYLQIALSSTLQFENFADLSSKKKSKNKTDFDNKFHTYDERSEKIQNWTIRCVTMFTFTAN